MSKNVKVVKVETVKGGKADRIVLHYVGSDGSTWKIGGLAAKLDENSRKILLAAKEGDTVSINIAKEGNYWNLVSAGPAEQQTTRSSDKPYNKTSTYKSSYQAPSPEDKKKTDVKIQVMNALTNAVVSLGSGQPVSRYKERVLEFVLLGNDVVDSILSGNLSALAAGATTDIDTNDDVVNELGF